MNGSPVTDPVGEDSRVNAQHVGTLGLAQGTALYIASVLGTGILVLPGLAASVAGPASIISVLAVFVLSIPLAGTFAVLAARYPDSGGVASYVRRTMGNTFARMTGYWFYFGVAAGMPVVAVLGAEYVVAIIGADRTALLIVAAVIYLPPFVLNLFGVRLAGWVQLGLTALLIVVVIGVVAYGMPAVRPGNFQPFFPHGITGIGQAISLFVWAFAGWEVGTHIAAEFKNPRKVIPLATGIALVVVGVAYLALQWITVGVLGEKAGEGTVPLLALVDATAPKAGAVIIASIAAIVSLGVLNAYLAAVGKLGAALGRDGDLPQCLSPGSEANEVPRRSLLIVLAISVFFFGVLVAQDFNLLVLIPIHLSSMISIYALGMVAAVRIFDRWSFSWWLAVIATVMTAGLLALAWANLYVPLGIALVAVMVGLVKHRTLRVHGDMAG
ncbi:amino acid permease [Alpinimonas psychrophila]